MGLKRAARFSPPSHRRSPAHVSCRSRRDIPPDLGSGGNYASLIMMPSSAPRLRRSSSPEASAPPTSRKWYRSVMRQPERPTTRPKIVLRGFWRYTRGQHQARLAAHEVPIFASSSAFPMNPPPSLPPVFLASAVATLRHDSQEARPRLVQQTRSIR